MLLRIKLYQYNAAPQAGVRLDIVTTDAVMSLQRKK